MSRLFGLSFARAAGIMEVDEAVVRRWARIGWLKTVWFGLRVDAVPMGRVIRFRNGLRFVPRSQLPPGLFHVDDEGAA